MKLARKHTKFIGRDLPMLVEHGINRMIGKWRDQRTRFSAYKEKRVNDPTVHDLLIRAVDAGVCSNRLIPDVLHQWRRPEHEQFQPRNVWSLFNAFTAALKEGSLPELPNRTEALHGLLDSYAGVN